MRLEECFGKRGGEELGARFDCKRVSAYRVENQSIYIVLKDNGL